MTDSEPDLRWSPDDQGNPFALRDESAVRYRLNFAEPVFVAHPGDRIVITIGHAGEHAFAVTTPDRGVLGHGVLSHLNFHLVAARRGAEPPEE